MINSIFLINERGIKVVLVNPHHIKNSKELADQERYQRCESLPKLVIDGAIHYLSLLEGFTRPVVY